MNPRTIVCVARNYVQHARELRNEVPSCPTFFLKPVSSLVHAPDPIRLPPGALVHHEVELGVVLGRRAENLPDDPNAIESCIAGYCVAVDLTARNWQQEAKDKSLPWTLAKGCRTFLPCGPLVPKELLSEDPQNTKLQLRVNGQVKQSDRTSLMVHSIHQLLRAASSFLTLERGDLLLTGTPSGVGPISQGDVLEIEGLGTRTTFEVT